MVTEQFIFTVIPAKIENRKGDQENLSRNNFIEDLIKMGNKYKKRYGGWLWSLVSHVYFNNASAAVEKNVIGEVEENVIDGADCVRLYEETSILTALTMPMLPWRRMPLLPWKRRSLRSLPTIVLQIFVMISLKRSGGRRLLPWRRMFLLRWRRMSVMQPIMSLTDQTVSCCMGRHLGETSRLTASRCLCCYGGECLCCR